MRCMFSLGIWCAIVFFSSPIEAQVTAVDCQFDAQGEIAWGRWTNLDRGLEVQSSSLLLIRSSLRGRAFYHVGGGRSWHQTFEGVLATASRVVLIDCYATGGRGYCKPYMFGCTQWTQPAPAVTARSCCTIVVKGSTLIGGKGAYSSCAPCNPTPAVGLIADATTKVIRDAGTSFSISGGRTTVQGVFDLQARGAPPGNPVPITIRSATPAPYAVFANHGMRPQGPPIAVWIDVTAPVLLFGDFVNGSRTLRDRTLPARS